MKKAFCMLLAILLFVMPLMSACTENGTDEPAGTQTETVNETETQPGAETEAPSEAPTETPTEAPTEAPTEVQTEPPAPVPCTVTFVNTVWEDVPSVELLSGSTLTAEAVTLREGVSFADGQAFAYVVPEGQTFTGDFSACEQVKLGEYVVTADVTLALSLTLAAAPLASLSDTERVNYYGRNYITDDKITFLNTDAGFEVRFVGKELKASFTVRGRGPVSGGTLGDAFINRIRIYKDGDMSIEGSDILTLDHSTDNKELVLASFDTYGVHRVLIRKISYEFWGYVELRSLTCDGGFCKAPDKPEPKILIFGDSLTCGYGNLYAATGDTGSEDPYKEDGSQTYATMLADHYGAEIQIYCTSGMSMAAPAFLRWSFMEGDRWHQYAYYDFNSVYDMTQYDPDIIICNLGTNDIAGLANGYAPYGNGGQFYEDDHFTWKSLRDAYLDFFKAMRTYYPDCPIVIVNGMLDGGATDVVTAGNEAVRKGGYENVYFFRMKGVELSENCGHPTIAGNVDAYNQLVDYIDKKGLLPQT